MKTKAYTTILAVIALMLVSAVGALAQRERQDGAQKPMQHDMSKMDMSSMMNEPHHALAMAYMQNIGTFAKPCKTTRKAAARLMLSLPAPRLLS